MRPITVTVGPLATASATAIATAQRNYGAGGALALLGTRSDFVAGTVAATQAPGSGAILINGTRAKSGIAYLNGPGQYVYITSSGDDHAITFTVVGYVGIAQIVVAEVLQGTNAQSVASTNKFTSILSISQSGAVAANITVGSFTAATLDTTRKVLFTTTANESANSATITGTDWAGTPISETVTLVNNSTVASALSYLTVGKVTIANAAAGNISVGTNGVAYSQWVRLDTWAPGPVFAQFIVTGTVSYDIQTSNDDPNIPGATITPGTMIWDSSITGIIGATAGSSINLPASPLFIRILLNSGTGTVTGTISQTGVNPI